MDQSIPMLRSNGPRNLARIVGFLSALPTERDYDLSVKERKRKRSESQNAKLWAIYGEIISKGGEAMAGWTKDDLHEFFLGNHFGWEIKQMFGKKKQVPVRRSSRLNKLEFAGFLESIFQFMAQQGVYIQ